MKKSHIILMLMVGILVFSSCGNSDSNIAKSENKIQMTTESENTTEENTSIEAVGDVDVEKSLFSVVITIPSDFIGDKTQEDLNNLADEYGYKSIVLNEDGSATYTMTKKQHQDTLSEYRKQINTGLEEMIGSEDYPNFVKIETNDNFTQFTITTKSKELDSNESLSAMVFYMYGGMYAAFSGEEVDNVSVTFLNEETGEIIESLNSKDAEKSEDLSD